MEKILRLYTYVDGGVNDTPFPNTETQVEIGGFCYDAKRMGGAPTITASVYYPSCLDEVWTSEVYTEFNGEKYYLKQTPTSSYSNEDARYKHDIELISERAILDNVYFYDAVMEGETPTDDKPVSNGTKFVFWGNIEQFKNRLNASLRYSGMDYVAVVDEGVTSDEKLVSFDNAFFSNAIQESYNVFDIPYYFVGKTIHFGYSEDVIEDVFEYGVDNALVSITKNNANYKTVNRVTGVGSSDNIPFYYPNNSPKGDIEAEVNTSSSEFSVNIVDYEKYSNEVAIGDTFTFLKNNIAIIKGTSTSEVSFTTSGTPKTKNYRFDMAKIVAEFEIEASFQTTQVLRFIPTNTLQCIASGEHHMTDASHSESRTFNNIFNAGVARITGTVSNQVSVNSVDQIEFEVFLSQGVNKLTLEVEYKAGYHNFLPVGKINSLSIDGDCTWVMEGGEEYSCWQFKDNCVKIEDYGLSYNGTPTNGDTITQRLVKYVKTSKNLVPPIYRETEAAERFYNATNDTYEGVEFANPYTEGHPKEHIITVDDLKPTIKETMVDGLRIDMFSEFAYDVDDNDETYEDEDGNVYYKHPYFFGKLRKMNFNLFDHAIENQRMVISFTSGNAGACSFEIGVTEEYPQKNPVQVDENGNLVYDDNGMVLCGCEGTDQVITEYQDSQQDTLNNEVWIALRKEEETYGILMPQEAHRPKACTSGKNDGDTFVILGINLPKAYILDAEKKLEAEIIKYMQENNAERFNFAIAFSRIYFEENPDVLQYLNENARINIKYNNKDYLLYVNSFSYQMSEGDILPQITVELDEALTISQNALQNAINQVKSEVGRALSNIDVLGLATPYFLRKDADDEANGRINFKKGIKFGEGGKVEVLDNNSAKLTIEYLEVTKKATFTSLEIQEKTHVGGQILVTPAAINCGEVEEFDDFYRCYFQTKGIDGDEIFNQFAVGDQAICQTYNAWGSRYYWRLVTGIGADYIDLSKIDCDEDSDVPSAGDKIIQLGNRSEEARQNAIVLSAYGDGSPYIIQYKGIDSFDIDDDKIATKLSSTENIFTGRVHMELGSDGLENIEGGLNIGGQNMLRNSGFTGNYLSEPLTDGIVMEESKDLFSDPLDFWFSEEYPKDNALVVDSEESSSGKELVLSNGSVTQELYQRVIEGEKYVLSFKAKGVTLTYNIGGVSKTLQLTDTWLKYVEKFDALSTNAIFSITNATCTLCDIQLERGTMATSWGMSPLDNSSDRAYYQALNYLSDAMIEGSTDFFGGLVLTNHIKVGDYANHVMTKETGGVNGKWSNDDSVVFWGGGSLDKAINTIDKFKNNPSYQPSQEEISSLANFVVTHGGRMIANDAVIRGTIYAKDGDFTGIINANGGNIGLLSIHVNPHTKEAYITSKDAQCRIGRMNTTFFSNDLFSAHSAYNTQDFVCATGYETTLNGIGVMFDKPFKSIELEEDEGDVVDILINHGIDEYNDGGFDGRETSIRVTSGMFEGFRPKTTVVDKIYHNLSNLEHSVLVKLTSGSVEIGLPNKPKDGQEYYIETLGATVNISSEEENIRKKYATSNVSSVSSNGLVRMKYYAEENIWTCTIIV